MLFARAPQTTATLPAIMVSVARRIPSTRDSLQPYLLSNLDLVTESLTLIAGKGSRPLLHQVIQTVDSGRRLLAHALDGVAGAGEPARRVLHALADLGKDRLLLLGRGTEINASSPASTRAPSRTYRVASPPSSRIRFTPSGKANERSR